MDPSNKQPLSEEGDLLSDFVLKAESSKARSSDLMVEPEGEQPIDNFSAEIQKSLSETEEAILDLKEGHDARFTGSWHVAREVIENFQPVPWFIWRISNFVFGKHSTAKPIPEGMLLGMRRLLFAAASDSFLGEGAKVNNLKGALEILSPDLVASVSVMHAICRRLTQFQFDRIWKPILEDAILRAQIGLFVGQGCDSFGGGRGMLAGFAGRCGLAILIATGELEQARKYLEMLAGGADINRVGLKLYGCDPLQVGGMCLSASGCGRDAAFGTVQFGLETSTQYKIDTIENEEQMRWFSAFTIIELLRMGREREIIMPIWETLGFGDATSRSELVEGCRAVMRRGHSLVWLM